MTSNGGAAIRSRYLAALLFVLGLALAVAVTVGAATGRTSDALAAAHLGGYGLGQASLVPSIRDTKDSKYPGAARPGGPAGSTTTPTSTPNPCASSWNIVPSPNQGTNNNVLRGIAVAGPNDIWAVGFYWTGSFVSQTLVEHWDGSSWSIVPSPNWGTMSENVLNEVAVAGRGNVWAVGYAQGAISQTLVEHWDGSSWSIIPSPNQGTNHNDLEGVEVAGPGNVWAVGHYYDDTDLGQTLVEHWDGSSWSIVPSPNLGTSGDFLNAVAVTGPGDVWAVGYYYDDRGVAQTLVEHWNGTAWSIIASPNQGMRSNFLSRVAVAEPGDLWAVGTYWTGDVNQTLVEQYTGACASDTPTTTPTPTPATTNTPTITGTSVATGTSVPTSTASATATPTPATTNTPTITGTSVATGTSVPTSTASATFTSTSTSTFTVTPSPMTTACAISFTDVQPTEYFYEAVRALFCRGVISGYSDNTFRPYNNTTRAQLTKIVTLAEGWQIVTPQAPTFRDVPVGDPFYPFVETAYSHQVVSGYGCGDGCLEFRPGANVTRAQLSKIIVLASGWQLANPPAPTFQDVPQGDPFYRYVETAYAHGIISGYGCGSGCLAFRPGNAATRGQICKIVYNAVR